MNVLAIDQGTSATKALLVGPGRRGPRPRRSPGARCAAPATAAPRPDPAELLASVLAAGAQALAAAGAPAHAVALANQGETVLAWDRPTGRPLSTGDRLAGPPLGRDLRAPGRHRRTGWPAITGLPLDPYFAAPKMTWLRENRDHRRAWSPPPTAGCWRGSARGT